ncbi:hypothetical protein AVEN_173239-1 [Araneus ventricosus]|uniref:Uncharacterized protein n=1 Tax=Araneus ventricosus TaxID=182803 RepID=A0A4Y2H0D5_ARAVE|nr:hypothetical protein AVEN_173239-1 [Araneus ventricosus]
MPLDQQPLGQDHKAGRSVLWPVMDDEIINERKNHLSWDVSIKWSDPIVSQRSSLRISNCSSVHRRDDLSLSVMCLRQNRKIPQVPKSGLSSGFELTEYNSSGFFVLTLLELSVQDDPTFGLERCRRFFWEPVKKPVWGSV